MAAYMQRIGHHSQTLWTKQRILLFSHPASTLSQSRLVHQLYSHRMRTMSKPTKPTGGARSMCRQLIHQNHPQPLIGGAMWCQLIHHNHPQPPQPGADPRLGTGLHLSGSPVRFCHSQSGGEPKPPSDPHQAARRTRLLTYLGAFVLLHLCVLWGRRYYKNQDRKTLTGTKQEPADTEGAEYVDPDLGKTAKMFHHRGYLLPHFAKEALQAIEALPVRDGDVFVSSFPKSGTTWVQEMVYQIIHVDDKPDPAAGNMEQRFPYLEFIYPGVKEIRRQDGPRLIKTHLPHALLPTQAKAGNGKVIYVARNPKDVSVSYYHYVRMLAEVGFNGNYEKFFEKFINDKVAYGPWWKHVVDYWEHREDTNVLFVTYEELQQDLSGSVMRVARFLGRDLTAVQVTQVTNRCSFSSMRRNPDTNYSWWQPLGLTRPGETDFMRKGVVGDWRHYCTSDMVYRVDAMTNQRLAPAGLQLPDSVQSGRHD